MYKKDKPRMIAITAYKFDAIPLNRKIVRKVIAIGYKSLLDN